MNFFFLISIWHNNKTTINTSWFYQPSPSFNLFHTMKANSNSFSDIPTFCNRSFSFPKGMISNFLVHWLFQVKWLHCVSTQEGRLNWWEAWSSHFLMNNTILPYYSIWVQKRWCRPVYHIQLIKYEYQATKCRKGNACSKFLSMW